MATSGAKTALAIQSLVEAGLQSSLTFPSDQLYSDREGSYWSNTAKLRPACIFLPQSSQQVSEGLKVLVACKQTFAVRSGGHAPLATSNNIHQGVTIDLSLLTSIRYDPGSETVTFGPGLRWKHVYEELQKYDRVVAGGRESDTGVAGLLLGGGNTWFTARKGFACDNVVSYDVVLADGSSITADAANHVDLFRALKGGSNNFGIVVSFTMSTIPCRRIWGGTTMSLKQHAQEAIQCTANFTSNIKHYPDSSLLTGLTYVPQVKEVVMGGVLVETRGVEDSPAFDEWRKLPKLRDTTTFKSMLELGLETGLPSNLYATWFTLTIKNDTRIMNKAAEVHDELVAALHSHIPAGDFTTQCLFQPLPMEFAKHSVATGGNMMGIERHEVDAILLQINTMVQSADQQDFAYAKVKACIQTVKDYAATIEGGLLDWVYLNYADQTQDVLGSYGTENLEFMRSVARKYDPDEVFQKLCVGGFKLSDSAM
ncbi:hypothetical protein F4778DRAFT_759092 [Xylariomycetidae sp. FL2044]|nr:hypothetical protein F4778DRAFT_759092 [Xylariomycetidae sp. FL2044]